MASQGRILAGCDDGGLHAWRLSDMEHGIIEGHEAAIWSIAWVDEYLISGSSDGNLKVTFMLSLLLYTAFGPLP